MWNTWIWLAEKHLEKRKYSPLRTESHASMVSIEYVSSEGGALLEDRWYYINKVCNRGVHWKLSSREIYCWLRLMPRWTVEFEGWLFPMYPSIADFIYHIMLNVVKSTNHLFTLNQSLPFNVLYCNTGVSVYSNAQTSSNNLSWTVRTQN
jgi:hypothetical protein